MAVRAKKTKIVVDEMAKLDKGEVEFLFDTIKGAMIPGKYLPIAMKVVQKLKNQYYNCYYINFYWIIFC